MARLRSLPLNQTWAGHRPSIQRAEEGPNAVIGAGREIGEFEARVSWDELWWDELMHQEPLHGRGPGPWRGQPAELGAGREGVIGPNSWTSGPWATLHSFFC